MAAKAQDREHECIGLKEVCRPVSLLNDGNIRALPAPKFEYAMNSKFEVVLRQLQGSAHDIYLRLHLSQGPGSNLKKTPYRELGESQSECIREKLQILESCKITAGRLSLEVTKISAWQSSRDRTKRVSVSQLSFNKLAFHYYGDLLHMSFRSPRSCLHSLWSVRSTHFSSIQPLIILKGTSIARSAYHSTFWRPGLVNATLLNAPPVAYLFQSVRVYFTKSNQNSTNLRSFSQSLQRSYFVISFNRPKKTQSFYQLTTLPKHVQRFITPSVRRVYIDTTHSQALQRQLTRAKSQIRELVKESQDLQASNLSKKRKLEEVDGVVNRLAKSHCQLLEQYSLKKSKLQEAGDVTQEWKERYNDLLEANVAKKRELARANSEAAEWKRKYEALFKLPVKLAK